MKNLAIKTFTLLLIAHLFLNSGCKKKSDESTVILPVPVVTTDTYSKILLNTVEFTGSVNNDAGSFVTKRGFCWSSTNQTPTIGNDTMVAGDGSGAFTATLKGLRGQSKYYIRAFATNKNGTGYGSTYSIATIDSTVKDKDNNKYGIVQIGKQVWMKENLRTKHYRNGNPVLLVTDSIEWTSSILPAYCWFNNDPVTFSGTFGALYNYYAVSSGNLAPVGWRVPVKNDFSILIDFLGGELVAGGKLKEAGLAHWSAPNSGADNSSGFSALPGGNRFPFTFGAIFGEIYDHGNWWSMTQNGSDQAIAFFLRADNPGAFTSPVQMNFGYSIRCIRDEQ